MARVIVCTACDGGYDHYTVELMASLAAITHRDFAIGFLRIGDAPIPPEISNVADLLQVCREAGPALGPGDGLEQSYLAIKPRMPEFFPDFDIYIWIDGDAWVQNVDGIAQLIAATDRDDLAGVPEMDVAYWRCLFPNDYAVETYNRIYGRQGVQDFARFPMLNSGVIAARAGSKLWPMWKAALIEARQLQEGPAPKRYSDQIPLHRLIYTARLTLNPLRATNNWMVKMAPPLPDVRLGKLCCPTPPYDEINILHLISSAKTDLYDIGGGRELNFRYSRVKAFFEEFS